MLGFLEWLSWDGLWDWVHDHLTELWDWLWGVLSPYVMPFVNAVLEAWAELVGLYDTAITTLTPFAPYIRAVNAWVPVDVLINCLGIYLTFLVALVIYRSIKKWIPTLSG